MRNKNLIGRTEEIALLEEYFDSDKSELIAVYGRRRVGKTDLTLTLPADISLPQNYR